MRVVVVDPPPVIVSWDEAQQHLRLDGDDERTIVEAFIAAAQEHIDGPAGWLGRAIGPQTLEASGFFGAPRVRLPYPPVIDVVAVFHEDAAGAEVEVPTGPATWRFSRGVLSTAVGASWVTQPGQRVRYRAGYDLVPAPIRAAILLMVGDLYRNRESTGDGSQVAVPMSTTVDALLSPFRVWS